MLKSYEKFHLSNGRRQLLIADDEFINREILKKGLQDEFDLIFAEDGNEAFEKIVENSQTLSLIILDNIMPGMSGLDVLNRIKETPEIKHIPVIVTTSDRSSEIASLTTGASDFIPKPYPDMGVIVARIKKTIELAEDRQIIKATERDAITGLYNKEFFFKYAEQFDLYHRDTPMDAIILDVYHFHMINERFGTAFGDEILRRIGNKVSETVSEAGGLACRRDGDTFLIYCPHGADYRAILRNAAAGLSGDIQLNSNARLRLGVYENADKSIDMPRRFDRAKVAADKIRKSFSESIGIYDNTMHEKEMYEEQLIYDFKSGIEEKQFLVYFQPKYNIKNDKPVLSSAEALVRWNHPKMGFISPGVFIPLFEERGLIRELDEYVWRTAGSQMKLWREKFGFSIPVSVNMSRVDMYDPALISTLLSILKENELTPDDMLLEVTESAYTEELEQIVLMLDNLRKLGFHIEMDDFGTGYSSLNMVSTLPIDALKLDMQFIRNAFSEKKDTKLLEIILDIADYLSVPVIAEGVETEEQYVALKQMGCDLIQGYYFSKPVSGDEFEKFLIDKKSTQAG